jgi:hypothetical protein
MVGVRYADGTDFGTSSYEPLRTLNAASVDARVQPKLDVRWVVATPANNVQRISNWVRFERNAHARLLITIATLSVIRPHV